MGGGCPMDTHMNLPPLSFTNTSASKTGDLASSFGNDASGFSVNYGNGVSQGGSLTQDIKTQLIVAAIVGLAVYLWKKST